MAKMTSMLMTRDDDAGVEACCREIAVLATAVMAFQ